MSEVIVAKNAGFCPGVRSATERLAKRIATRGTHEVLVTLGHLIHNEDYNNGLLAQGVRAVRAEDLPALAAGATPEAPITVFIRAHGIPVGTRSLLERLAQEHPGFSFEDCTCPFVSKIHRIAAEKD
ncbi:MAG: hypothetical protein IKD28_00280, partial [Clostridia bacterium]|nr:hypothetical protein [Clostridia bacterium]